jgi:pimeloyl-ACP methyl ester carboxylesterase
MGLLMEKKENSPFLLYFSLSVTAIFLTVILLLLATSAIFIALGLINQNQIAIAQQQQQQQELQNNQTSLSSSSLSKQQNQQPTLEGISFDIDNMTFSHHMASVNGIQLHYVIGGQGDPIVLLHGWPETWYEWRHIIPELIANNYTVIAPDMRGLGDSEKPLTGYDKKTIAEDIYQLVKKLGYGKIYIVAHDWGGPVAYSYAAAHPEDVRKMIMLDTLLPGFGYEEAGNFSPNGLWHFSFHAVRDLPEKLIDGKEDVYLNWFYDYGSYNQSAITTDNRQEYIKQYSKPGAMRVGFEYYRSVFEDIKQNKEYGKEKLEIPILTIGGEAAIGNFTTTSFQKVASNVTGITLPNTGHFIPEERPNFVTKQILKFFGNNATTYTNQ